MDDTLLAIDPGRKRCGIALVNSDLRYLAGSVIKNEDLVDNLRGYIKKYGIRNMIVGSGTNSEIIITTVKEKFPEIFVTIIPERDTTIEARKYYFEYNPPRGWLRIIPSSLRIPPRPYDDFAAYAIARRFFRNPSFIPLRNKLSS